MNTSLDQALRPMAEKPAGKDSTAGMIKITVHAVGGQGGGVLASWIADLATQGQYAVQMTSVAGVAQRTGATIYYIEMAPKSEREYVFSLTPAPGDVDILIAAELMEAGRAVVRGFVTPDRTTLIASSHRILAVDEKTQPGDGRADSPLVYEKIKHAAHKTICFDMETIASANGSMISASLFGALAKSGEMPFSHDQFEEVIQRSGRGVDASLAAFRAALNYDEGVPLLKFDLLPSLNASEPAKPVGPEHLMQKWQQLEDQVLLLPKPVQTMSMAGLRKVVDYQDISYGQEYLDHVSKYLAKDIANEDFELTITAGKYIANAMCYDDIIRVADLKTRASRNRRLRQEQQADKEQIVHVTEYFHPGAAEVCGLLPAGIGRRIENSKTLYKCLDKLVNKGRRIRTDGMMGFLMLWSVSLLKPVRRKLLRHKAEAAHLDNLIDTSLVATEQSTAFAIEILKCQRLVKGYSDTHARGQSKYRSLMDAVELLKQRSTAAVQLGELRDTALKDETGEMLRSKLAGLAS